MTANLDLSSTYSRVVAGGIFGKRKCRGARDTEGVFSADGGGDRHVCVVSTEDNVTVGLNAVNRRLKSVKFTDDTGSQHCVYMS